MNCDNAHIHIMMINNKNYNDFYYIKSENNFNLWDDNCKYNRHFIINTFNSRDKYFNSETIKDCNPFQFFEDMLLVVQHYILTP